jgi:hypothetical protein
MENTNGFQIKYVVIYISILYMFIGNACYNRRLWLYDVVNHQNYCSPYEEYGVSLNELCHIYYNSSFVVVVDDFDTYVPNISG